MHHDFEGFVYATLAAFHGVFGEVVFVALALADDHALKTKIYVAMLEQFKAKVTLGLVHVSRSPGWFVSEPLRIDR